MASTPKPQRKIIKKILASKRKAPEKALKSVSHFPKETRSKAESKISAENRAKKQSRAKDIKTSEKNLKKYAKMGLIGKKQ